MKEKKEQKGQKGSNKDLATPSLDEKKRRSSLTDTPITSSSSSEAGMTTNDNQQPCSSKTAAKKKRKAQKKANKAAEDQVEKLKNSLLPFENTETQPFYTSANTASTNTTIWSNANSAVTNYEMDNIVARPMDYTKNEWMRSMKKALVDGDYQVFLCGLRYMCIILYNGNPEYKSYTKQGLLRIAIKAIVTNFYDPTHQQTIFMNLCSTRSRRCAEVGHCFCRLARTLLQHMDPVKASNHLAIVTKVNARTALHLAVNTGDLCQVRVLLEYDIDVDARDRDNYTPLYYALRKKNLDMVKLLLWYGADFSQRPRFHQKLVLHAQAFEPDILYPWFEQRTNALTKRFYQFLAELCRGTLFFKAEDALSDLHVMRCSYNMDADTCSNGLETGPNWLVRSIALNMRENFEATKDTTALLFVVPFCYSPHDEGKSSKCSAHLPQFIVW
ncbi:hypothetical protein M3Y97_00077400 [Aphelenchoides bicaudatus]|nr:hypothetical protein M3Y97_00077400 [Aphelenchoides bicaudatus]